MPKAIETRVSRATAGGWVLEKIYVPKRKFKKGAMVSIITGKRSTFVSKKPRPDTWLIIGCLPKNYDKKKKRCKRTTVQKMIKAISESTAKRLLAKGKVKRRKVSKRKATKRRKVRRVKKARKKAANICKKLFASKKIKNRNPQLMIVTNPASLNKYPSRSIGLAGKAYKRFHFTRPAGLNEVNIPTGWPKVYMAIGECERFDVKTPKGIISRRFTGKRPVLATTSAMKNLYIFGKRLGIPAGRASRVDYRVPPHSGRTKWARRWWHPHKTHPSVRPHRGGGAVKVSGSGLKITPRGIEG